MKTVNFQKYLNLKNNSLMGLNRHRKQLLMFNVNVNISVLSNQIVQLFSFKWQTKSSLLPREKLFLNIIASEKHLQQKMFKSSFRN
jgi:hypothetical protein